ncbi:hypothetical protein Ddc_24501 [Ditylenchus destructor]|nr:hypothetical protein Ddc_24501 [Ditylenchus destructor]
MGVASGRHGSARRACGRRRRKIAGRPMVALEVADRAAPGLGGRAAKGAGSRRLEGAHHALVIARVAGIRVVARGETETQGQRAVHPLAGPEGLEQRMTAVVGQRHRRGEQGIAGRGRGEGRPEQAPIALAREQMEQHRGAARHAGRERKPAHMLRVDQRRAPPPPLMSGIPGAAGRRRALDADQARMVRGHRLVHERDADAAGRPIGAFSRFARPNRIEPLGHARGAVPNEVQTPIQGMSNRASARASVHGSRARATDSAIRK